MKIVLRTLLVLSLMLSGFVSFAFVASRFLVPEGSGLAGGAIVFSYGFGGALLCAVIGLVLGWRLSRKNLVRVSLGLVVVAAVLCTLSVMLGSSKRPSSGGEAVGALDDRAVPVSSA